MTLSYGGIPLSQPTLEDILWFEQYISPADVLDFDYPAWQGDHRQRWTFTSERRYATIKLNCLYWPTGAAHWAFGHFLVTDEQLKRIRALVYDFNLAAQYKSQSLVMSDARSGRAITTNLFALPPRPLAQITGHNGWHILTLVDERYFWWEKTGIVTVTAGTTTWIQLYDAIAALLGVQLFADPVSADYLNPAVEFTSRYESLPLLLDEVAANVGQRLVRKLDGTLVLQNPLVARTSLTNQQAAFAKEGGGLFAFNANGPNDLPGHVPATVLLTFPRVDSGVLSAAPYTISTTLQALALVEFGQIKGHTGTKVVPTFTVAAFAGGATPLNETELQNLTKQYARDWYRWLLARVDTEYVGIVPWVPVGSADHVEWTYREDACHTRVQRAWPDNYSLSIHGTYGSSLGVPVVQGPPGPAIFLIGEDGESGDMGPPGRAGDTGATGAQGPMGPAVFLVGEDGEDGMMGVPGNQGSTGPTGAPGAQGQLGPALFLVLEEDESEFLGRFGYPEAGIGTDGLITTRTQSFRGQKTFVDNTVFVQTIAQGNAIWAGTSLLNNSAAGFDWWLLSRGTGAGVPGSFAIYNNSFPLDLLIIDGNTSFIGSGLGGDVAPSAKMHFTWTDSLVSTTAIGMIIDHNSSEATAAGFGSTLDWRLKTSTTAARTAARYVVTWNVATDAVRAGQISFYVLYISTEREALRMVADADGAVVDIRERLQLTGDITPTSLSGDQNDYGPTNLAQVTVIRQASSASVNITGLAGGADGRIVIWMNVSSTAVEHTLKNESVSSTAANRFALNADVMIKQHQAYALIYDATASRWRLLGMASTTGSGITTLNTLTAAVQTFTWTDTATINGTITPFGSNHDFTALVIDDSIIFAKMQNLADGKLIGRDGGGAGDPTEVDIANQSLILANKIFGQRDIPGLSNPLIVARGGTGITFYAIGEITFASATTTLSKLSPGLDGKVLTTHGTGNAPTWEWPGSLAGVGGIIFAESNPTVVANTVSESSLLGTGQLGDKILPANFLTAGMVIKISLVGIYGTFSTAPDLLITVNLGSTVILSCGSARTLNVSQDGQYWCLEAQLLVRTDGATGTIVGAMEWRHAYNETEAALDDDVTPTNNVLRTWTDATNSTGVTLDTTASQEIDVRVTWSSAQTTNTITTLTGTITVLRAKDMFQ